MADNYGAKPYDYSDYYAPIRGRNEADTLKGNEVAPGMSITDKLRALFGAIGISQEPVNPQAMGVGAKLRGGLGLAPMIGPTATQADVRKSDMAMAGPGAVVPPVVPTAATPAPVAAPAPAFASAAPAMEPAYTGMTAADIHGTTIPPRGTGAILNESTGKVTNIGSPTPAGPGAVPQGYQAAPGSLASFFGGAVRQRSAAAGERAAQAAALKLPETMKSAAEATILSERMKLAAAEPDPARKAAILAGHVMSEPKLQAPPNMQPMPGDKDQSGVVFDPAKGAFRKVPITQAATTANIDAALAGSMKGKTRAQVIQAYKDKGYDVSGVK